MWCLVMYSNYFEIYYECYMIPALRYVITQFNLYTRVWVHRCACMFTSCKTSKSGIHTLLDVMLVCMLIPVNACDKWDMHVTSLYLISYTIHVVYRYSNCSYRQWNTSVLQLISCLCTVINTKYVGVSLLIYTWKRTVETVVKLYTHSLSYI